MSPTETKLEEALSAAETRLEQASVAIGRKHEGREREEWFAAHESLLNAERALAEARREPFAEPIDFPVQWDVGAPTPLLLSSEHRTFVVFRLQVVDPHWDGTYVKMVHMDDPAVGDFATIEFSRCRGVKMGSPNDEAVYGHPLFGKGYENYSALRVRNSTWIEELKQMNSVHPEYCPEKWSTMNHFIFGFHGSTIECVAEGFEVEAVQTSMPDIVHAVSKRLLV